MIPIILATVACSNWTQADYRELDKPVSQAFRRLLALLSKSSKEMLYLSTTHSGIGLPHLSDKAQVAE
jgi:hypothetical protein